MTLPGAYNLGRASPGSDADRALRARAGYPAVVMRLRYHGVYLPVSLIKSRPIPLGLVISQEVDSNNWHVTINPITGHASPLLPVLTNAELRRRGDGGMVLVDGREWDDGYLDRWPQTWLIAPTMDLGELALENMAGWLQARYRGKYGRS